MQKILYLYTENIYLENSENISAYGMQEMYLYRIYLYTAVLAVVCIWDSSGSHTLSVGYMLHLSRLSCWSATKERMTQYYGLS